MTRRPLGHCVVALFLMNFCLLVAVAPAAEKPQRQAIGRVTSAFGKAHADTAAGVRALDVQSLVYNDERITTDGGELTVLLASRVVLKVDLESAVDVLDDPGQTTLRVERGTVQVFVGQRTPQAGPVCVGDANGCVEAATGVFLVNYDPTKRESYFACEHASIDLHANDMSAHEKLSGDQQAIFRDGKLVSTGALERARFNETKKSLGRLDQAQASHGAETFRLRSRQLDTEAAIAQLSASGWIDRRVLPTPPTGGGNNSGDGDNSSANTGSGGKNTPTDVSTGKTGAEKTPPPPKDPVVPTTPGGDFFNPHDNEDHGNGNGHGNGNENGNANGHGNGKGSEVVFAAPPVAAPPITAPPVNTPPVAAPPVTLPPAAPPPTIDLGLNTIPPVSGASGPGGSIVSAAPTPAPAPAPPPVQIIAPTPVPPIADSTPVTSSTNTQPAPTPVAAPAPTPAPAPAPPIAPAPTVPVVTSISPAPAPIALAPAPIEPVPVAPAPAPMPAPTPAPTPVVAVDLGLTSSTTVAPAPNVSTVTSPTVAPTGSTLTSPTNVIPTNTLSVTTVTPTGTTSVGTTSVATGTTSTGTGTATTALPSPTDVGTTTVTTSTPTVTRTSPKRPKR